MNQQLVQREQNVQDLQAQVHSLQIPKANALERAVAAESSNAQLTQEGQDYKRGIQELCNSRDATAALHEQAVRALQNAKNLAEAIRGEAVRRADEAEANLQKRQELQDSLDTAHNKALQELTASKGQLAAEQEARRAVSRDLAAAQKDVEEVVHHNCELQRVNAAMGDQVRQAQLDQLDLMARFEAQSAELTSVKAQVERMGRDASDGAQVQQQVQQQLQAKERLLDEVTDANKQLQVELAAQAAEMQQAVGDLREQVAHLQDQVARAQVGPSPAQEEAARLQMEVGALQQQLSTERNLVVEAQVTLTTTQEEGRKLLQRAVHAEGQVYHMESQKLNLSTILADTQQQLPALQTQPEAAAGGEQSATATAERPDAQVDTLQGATAELQRQLNSQAAELDSTRKKLQESQVGCKALEKTQGRAARLQQELQAAIEARQVAEGKVMETTQKLAASEQQLKVVNEKKERNSRRKAELKHERSTLEKQVQGRDEELEAAQMQLQEEIAQNAHLRNQVELLQTQVESVGLEPALVEQADDHDATDTDDALSFPEANTTASQRGQGENEVMSPLGSALGSPQIAAGWGGQLDEGAPSWGGQLDEGASSWGGQLDEGASSCSNVVQSLEGHIEGASGIEEAASSADAGSVADVSSTADGGDGGVKEDGWEEVKGTTSKAKTKVLPIKLKGSRSNAGRSSTREKSRLGNPNVVEAPRPRGNAGLHSNGGESKRGNASNVLEVTRPKGNAGLHGNGGESKRGNPNNVLEVLRSRAR
ncbi:hypothetical protein WJX82_006938 [Trebouxia sp. C0006]